MIIFKKAFPSVLVYLTIFYIATLSAEGPAEKALIEGARPIVEENQDGLFVLAPEINNLIAMNVRVYNNSNELVLDVQSHGEMVDLQAIDLPDGKYRYHANTVFELDEPISIDGIEEREAISRTVGQFRIQKGELVSDEVSRFEESTSMSGSIKDGATSLLAWALSVVVEDAIASEEFGDFIKISGADANIFFNDTDGDNASLVEWEIVATSSADNTSGRWALYDWVGTAYPQSDPVIIIDTVENSAIVNSFIVGSNGDLSWANMGMWFDRSQQDLALGSTSTPRDFNIYDSMPDILLHDESDTSEVVIQQSNGTLIFWGRPTSAGNPASGKMMTMDTSAPTGSLDIEANGHLSAAQSASIGTAINTTGTIFSIGNSGSTRAQMEFEDDTGSSYIEWGQDPNKLQIEGAGGVSTVEFDLSAPEFSLALEASGNVGFGTRNPDASMHVRKNDGTAKILVEELNAAAPRTLLQLKNNGMTKLGISNTGTGIEWVIANSDTGLQFSREGSADVEMEVLNNGNLVIAGGLSVGSDVNSKIGITNIDVGEVLNLVANLPITKWQYKDALGEMHIGPMAQDFHSAFGLGSSETNISTIDTAGVALAAIQALNQKLVKQNQSLEQRVFELEQQNQRIVNLVTRLALEQTEQITMK